MDISRVHQRGKEVPSVLVQVGNGEMRDGEGEGVDLDSGEGGAEAIWGEGRDEFAILRGRRREREGSDASERDVGLELRLMGGVLRRTGGVKRR